jgi:hypothetical protein
MRFDTEKCQEGKENVAPLDNLFASLTFFDTSILLHAPVKFFDVPPKIFERFSVRF